MTQEMLAVQDAAEDVGTRSAASPKKHNYKKSEVITAYCCLLPSFVLMMLFITLPLILSLYFSLFDVNYYLGNTFAGLENYGRVLFGTASKEFYRSILIGLEYVAMIVPVQLILSFLVASLVMKINKKYAAVIKVAIYLPCLLSGIVVGAIFSFLYNYEGGLLNTILEGVGLDKVNWTNAQGWAIFAVCIAAIWNGLGYNTLIMLGGLYDIPKDFYEAAKLDGANWWKQTVYITVPSLKNVGIYLLISLVVSSFQLYEIALVIVGAGALHSTEGPIYYLYYQFNYTKNMGEVYAASLIVAIVLTALSSVIFRLTSSEKSMD